MPRSRRTSTSTSARYPVDDTYEVSTDGRIRRADTRRELRITRHKSGYLSVGTRNERVLYMHRAVLITHVGPPIDGQCTRHLNGVRDDNRLENLAWGSVSENMADKVAHGTSQHGEQNTQAKFTTEQVVSIYRDPRRLADIAADYGVRVSAVYRIKARERWAHATQGLGAPAWHRRRKVRHPIPGR